LPSGEKAALIGLIDRTPSNGFARLVVVENTSDRWTPFWTASNRN
jgi:hypothetical protein